jgi:hypothetical protein
MGSSTAREPNGSNWYPRHNGFQPARRRRDFEGISFASLKSGGSSGARIKVMAAAQRRFIGQVPGPIPRFRFDSAGVVCERYCGFGCQSSSGVEQRTHKPLVGGSNPSSGTSLRLERSGKRRLPRRSPTCAGGPNPHWFSRSKLRPGRPAQLRLERSGKRRLPRGRATKADYTSHQATSAPGYSPAKPVSSRRNPGSNFFNTLDLFRRSRLTVKH